jgi:hypothetical protein
MLCDGRAGCGKMNGRHCHLAMWEDIECTEIAAPAAQAPTTEPVPKPHAAQPQSKPKATNPVSVAEPALKPKPKQTIAELTATFNREFAKLPPGKRRQQLLAEHKQTLRDLATPKHQKPKSKEEAKVAN